MITTHLTYSHAFSFDAGDRPHPRHCPRRMIYEDDQESSQNMFRPKNKMMIKNIYYCSFQIVLDNGHAICLMQIKKQQR